MEMKSSQDKLALAAGENVKEKQYWLNKLSGELIKTYFPYDYKKDPLEEAGRELKKNVKFTFPGTLFSAAMHLSGGVDVKLHMILVTGLFILLYKYTGNKDIMIGSPILKQELEGEFINTVLVFRNDVGENMKFKELLLEVRKTIIQANENQNYPMEILSAQLNAAAPTAGNEFPLFDTAILLESLHDKRYIQDINYHMLFSFSRTDESIEGAVEYHSSLYHESTVKRIINHYLRLLGQVLSDVNVKLSQIDILSGEERQQLLVDFNNKESLYQTDKTLQQLFEEQAARTPDGIAIHRTYRTYMTYDQLNNKSNQLAHLLREKGVKPDIIVGIMVEPSIEMTVGILGILKAGGAYLPIDPDYPENRIHYMLEDSGARILVSEVSEVSEGIELILIDQVMRELTVPPTHLTHPTHPNHLSYIIYTSGTTGKPKGVMVEHQNVVAYLHAFLREFQLNAADTVIQLASYCFDVFIEEVFPVLLKGGKLLIPGADERKDMDVLSRLIVKHQVNVIDCTPLLLNEFNKLDASSLSSVHTFINGGDVLKEDYVNNLLKVGKVYNTYGPTESTVCATYYSYTPSSLPSIPIGKPIANYKIYIIDKALQLVPLGVGGELCVGGPGVTRGCLNQPELTAEKFVISHLSLVNGQSPLSLMTNDQCPMTIYRTGDLARWLTDGNIEFLGRIDQQVKIRGFRIELGEIESCLLGHDLIKEAVVIDRKEEDVEKYLCGYVVVDKGKDFDLSKLREYISGRLPAYMTPSYFIQVEQIPLTPNGKVDRRALPTPEVQMDGEYVAPSNEIEKTLTTVWSEVLSIDKDKISVNASFFEVGGHSLNAIILVTKIHKVFDVKIPLKEIFLLLTIRKLAAYIRDADRDRHTPHVSIESVEKREYYPLSPAQARLFTLHHLDRESTTFNIPLVVILEGDFDRGKFEETIKKLIHRHESFRTFFQLVGREPVQRIHHEVNVGIEGLAAPADKENSQLAVSIIETFIRPFDLSQAPLLRVGLIKIGKEKHILAVDMHHIISDAVSTIVLMKDFLALYEGKPLPLLRLQYRDYAAWQRSLVDSREMQRQRVYWLERFSSAPPLLEIPTDFPRPSVQRFEGGSIEFEIYENLTSALRAAAAGCGVTLYMLLLSIFTILLSKYTGQRDIIVGTPVIGRNHADLEDIIGFFINVLPMRNYPEPGITFEAFLKEVRKNTLNAFENQDYPFGNLVEELKIQGDTSRNPLYDVVFTVFKLGVPEMEIPGLKLSPYNMEDIGAKTDLRIAAIETEKTIHLELTYSTALFKKSTAQRMVKRFIEVVWQVTGHPQIRLKDITITDEIVTLKPSLLRREEMDDWDI